MARIRAEIWRTVLVVAAIVLVIGMAISGLLTWLVAVIFILIAMGGGALLYKTLGPPTR